VTHAGTGDQQAIGGRYSFDEGSSVDATLDM
jgi:hypothetical protein